MQFFFLIEENKFKTQKVLYYNGLSNCIHKNIICYQHVSILVVNAIVQLKKHNIKKTKTNSTF